MHLVMHLYCLILLGLSNYLLQSILLTGTVTVIFLLISIALLVSSVLEGQVHIMG